MEQQTFTEENLGKSPAIPVIHETRLTSTEIAALWTTYMDFSLVICMYKHFLDNVESGDVKSLMEYGMDIVSKRVAWVKGAFEKEGIPVPKGFSDEDVNLQAPRLYSDPFYLYYILNKTRITMNINSMALTTTTRPDIQEFYDHCCNSTATINRRVTGLLLEKGLYIRPPYITIQKTVDMIKKQSFLAGFFGERRPLLASEVSGLNYIVRINNLGKHLLIGFRQVAGSKQLRDFLDRGTICQTSSWNVIVHSWRMRIFPARCHRKPSSPILRFPRSRKN